VIFTPEDGGPDVIQSVEGTAVRNEADLKSALKNAGKGAIVSVKLYNGRVQQTRIERIRLE
jgi:S1-C subfamily serine protease